MRPDDKMLYMSAADPVAESHGRANTKTAVIVSRCGRRYSKHVAVDELVALITGGPTEGLDRR